MKKVSLFAAVECYPSDFVCEIEVPPFKTMPGVIMWGSRCFIQKTDDQYFETLAWYATTLK